MDHEYANTLAITLVDSASLTVRFKGVFNSHNYKGKSGFSYQVLAKGKSGFI